MIPIYKPYFTKQSLSYAHEAIDSTWVSSHGKFLSLAEEKLKEITQSKYVILTNNGTAATHLVACGLNYKYPEINNLFVPSNVYIAAWNMFKSNPTYKFFPLDANLDTWNVDMKKVPEEKKSAFLIVHNIGNIVNVPKMKKEYPNTVFVEDNCEGFLGSYEGKASGTASLCYSISFFGNKTLTSGEGGAFCTDDEEVYTEMNRVRAHGITSEKFIFDGLGYNYRMTNIQAALLYGQLESMNEIISKKEELFKLYQKELQHDKIFFQKSEDNVKNPNWMFGIRFDLSPEKMDKLKLHMQYNDVETRPMFPPIDYHTHYNEGKKTSKSIFPISEKLYKTVIILPSYPELTHTEVKYICKTVKDFFK